MLHLQKLSVGTESPETLALWQSRKPAQSDDGLPRHITRMWPKRETELLVGGSIYWVIKGMIQCRQSILRLDEYYNDDGVKYCAIVMDPNLVMVSPTPRRAFQGWRYFQAEDTPADLSSARQSETSLPPALSKALAEIGVR